MLIAIEFRFLICLWQIGCTGRDAVPDDESVKFFCDKVASFCSVDGVHCTVHEHYFYSFFCSMLTLDSQVLSSC